MSNDYYVVATKEESDICLEECYRAHIKQHQDKNTLRWAFEAQRLTDSKYIVPVCSHYTNPHNFPIETKTPEWDPQEEDI